MQVGKLYNTERFGLVLILKIQHRGFQLDGVPYFKVHVLMLDQACETDGLYTQSDWMRTCKPLV
jgi:hypothetical protein